MEFIYSYAKQLGDACAEYYGNKVHALMQDFNTAFNQELSRGSLAEVKKKQQYLTKLCHDFVLERVATNGDGFMKKVVNACSMPHSADWLSSTPGAGRCMAPGAFRLALRQRFGMVILSHQGKCDNCSGVVDQRALHTITCPGRHQLHHNIVRDTLLKELKKCHLNLDSETPNLINGSKCRPADVLICGFKNCRDCCVDVAIVSAVKGEYSTEKGINIRLKEEEKRKKYGEQLRKQHLDFMPFVMESTGGFGTDALTLIQDIARSVNTIRDKPAAVIADGIRKRIQFAWQMQLGSALLSMVRSNAPGVYG